MKKIYVLIVLAFALRILWLPDNLFFGYEQGRDFLKLAEIAGGNLTLIGPKTDIDGLFHGAFSYYSLLPSFLIFGGNPYLVLVSLILVHAVSIVFLYKFAEQLKGKKFALIAAFMYAVSYSAVIYARWLSNPNLVPALVIFGLYFLQKSKENKNFVILTAVFWALILHLQIVAALIMILPIAYFLLANKIVTFRNAIFSMLVIFVILGSYVVFNFRHDNILVNSFLNYLGGASGGVVHLDELYNDIVDNFFPMDRKVAFLLFWAVLIPNLVAARKEFSSRFILVLYFSAPVMFLLLQVAPLRHLLMLNAVFVPILIANAAVFLYVRRMRFFAFVIPAVIIMANMHAIFTRLPENDRNFLYHAQRTYLGDTKRLIDFVYKEAEGNGFSYDYFSVPYWQSEAWRYMFGWYGKGKYGYLPSEDKTEIFYVLIEPDETQPKYQEDWYKKLSEESVLLAELFSGRLKAEKRRAVP